MPSQNIQWFPGHMAKTRRLITESLGLVDIIIELAQPDLFRYATIQQQLETVFHRHVDLISAHAHLPESFQARLEQEAIYV